VYGDACVGVRSWVKHFKDGITCIAVQAVSHAGVKRISAISERMEQKVDALVKEDRKVTVREMRATLEYRQICSRWVSCLFTNTKTHA